MSENSELLTFGRLSGVTATKVPTFRVELGPVRRSVAKPDSDIAIRCPREALKWNTA
jgi:hypothetical protein